MTEAADMAAASDLTTGTPTKKVIVFVWDGLRPDSVTQADTPNLYAMKMAGVDFQDNHSTYPTFTMMNLGLSLPGANGRPLDEALTYHVIQRGAGRAYDVSRDALYRIGSFPEWASLATLLARPRGSARVVPLLRAAERTAAGTCRWYDAGDERICWSSALRLPLVVEGAVGGVWTRVAGVESAQIGPISAAIFSADASVTRVDVDRDLD